jgi:CheY-like chemotaxis protein
LSAQETDIRNDRTPAVLVVEDEPLIRMTAADLIADAGWHVLEAADATEALDVIAAHPEVTVLFTDVNMPGPVDGLRLAECVHRNHPHIELVVTSGRRNIIEDALPDDGTFLPKPYKQADLVRVLTEKLC